MFSIRVGPFSYLFPDFMLGVFNSTVTTKFVQLHYFLSQIIGRTKDIVSPLVQTPLRPPETRSLAGFCSTANVDLDPATNLNLKFWAEPGPCRRLLDRVETTTGCGMRTPTHEWLQQCFLNEIPVDGLSYSRCTWTLRTSTLKDHAYRAFVYNLHKN